MSQRERLLRAAVRRVLLDWGPNKQAYFELRDLFEHVRAKGVRPGPNARELLNMLIEQADIVRAYPFGGGQMLIECSQNLLDELAMFDADEREDDEREVERE